jgi:hypothetical protein
MHGTRIEKGAEIYATNLDNKNKCMSTHEKDWGGERFVKICSIYH